MREPGYEVHIDVRNSSGAQRIDIGQCLLRCVQATNGFDLLVDKRLRAEAYPVRAALEESIEDLRTKSPRRTFYGDLRVGLHVEFISDRLEDASELIWRERGGRSTAKIDRIDGPFKFRVKDCGSCFRARDLLLKLRDISVHLVARKHARSKVAEAALRAAKRNGDVEAEWHED